MKKNISISITTAYETLGELTERTKRVWIVAHGYGQLAAYFIKHFECLDLEENYIIAPQGLSKCYQSGFSGRVGAIWMTSEDREQEIANYIRLLSSIYAQELQGRKIETVLLGFSQGAATISRFAMLTNVAFDALILWGGRFPPDLDPAHAIQRIGKKPFLMYIGNQDPLITPAQREEVMSHMKQHGLLPQLFVYEGEHKLYTAQILEAEKIIKGRP